jgi:hypothetical protein
MTWNKDIDYAIRNIRYWHENPPNNGSQSDTYNLVCDELERLRSEVDRLQYDKDMLTMRNRQLEDELSTSLQGHDD